MKSLAIIPARGGSKRIPRKNIRNFLGKPIIAYSIETALQSELFTEVMVSTDDEEIAEIAKSFGAKVPFLRSLKNSNDFATTSDVITEVIANYELRSFKYPYACCIYPTAPLLRKTTLQMAYELMLKKSFHTVFPVVSFGYPIWRSLRVDNGRAEMIWPENKMKRSQELPAAWHDAGQFYWVDVMHFKELPELFTSNSGVIELQQLQVQDIDNIDDWKLAELKAKIMYGQ